MVLVWLRPILVFSLSLSQAEQYVIPTAILFVRFLPARVKCDMRKIVQVLKLRVSLTASDMQQTVIIRSLHCSFR